MGAIYNIMAAPFFFIRKLKKTKFYWWKTHGVLNVTGKLALVFVDKVFTAGANSFPLQTKKLAVVGHAIDTQIHVPGTSEKTEEHQVLIVGRITPIKKIEIAIDTVVKFVGEGGKARLKVIGPIDDESYYNKLKKMSEESITEGVIRFVGSLDRERLVEEYKKSWILLNPSYEAGFDKVVLEAMSCGVIPVTSISSFRPLLEEYGLFVPPKDVAGYVSVLRRLSNISGREREELLKTLRDEVVSRHSVSTLAQRIFGNSKMHQ